MPSSKKLIRAGAATSSSCSDPTSAKIGRAIFELTTGAALCATTQIEHAEDSVWFGWVCVDSATAVHIIRDRQSHASHRTEFLMLSCIGLDSH